MHICSIYKDMQVRSEQIRRLRREKDLSQEYMAEILGLSQSQYSRIESGESRINLDKANRIAEILNVNPQKILSYYNQKQFNAFWNHDSINLIKKLDNDQERQLYIDQIKELKADKEFLKSENQFLKQMLDNFMKK
jgi:transcriptional regulator with XRE-family HTH domain